MTASTDLALSISLFRILGLQTGKDPYEMIFSELDAKKAMLSTAGASAVGTTSGELSASIYCVYQV